MRRLLPLLGCVLVLAACGGARTVSPTPETVQGTVSAPPPPPPPAASSVKGDPAAGKGVFAKAGCGGCHTLQAAGSSGNVGPNLDDVKPPLALILDRVTNGKPPMPAFKGQLTDKQIADVAAFVFQSTHS
jgi:mono/diheme cytochrome c family protein